jgi:hypothetical protein
MLSDRVLGYVIMLVGGLFWAGMIIVNSNGIVVGKSGGFFFVWTLFALSTTGWVTMILSARGIWTTLRSHPRVSPSPWPKEPPRASPPERRRHSRWQ